MPRNISFMMTKAQVRDRSKTVTRRFGWWDAKPGLVLQAVEQAQGIQKGCMVRLGLIRVVTAIPEPLRALIEDPMYGAEECRKEGYPFGIRNGWEFAERLAKESKRSLDDPCMRIEFEYL